MTDQPTFDLKEAHCWFAVQFNNAAWDLVEKEQRSLEEDRHMLDLAHGASLHWALVGTLLHRQRAFDLLAHACASAGLNDQAVQYAEQAYALSEANSKEQTPFDRAEAQACLCRALRAAGRADEAAAWHERALGQMESLSADERSLIAKLMRL